MRRVLHIDAAELTQVGVELSGTLGAVQHGDIIAERYRLDRKIGQGGTGSIWLAQDGRLDRQVAIKFLFASNPAHQERLAKRVALEAKIAASIQHRNVVQIFDFGTHQTNIPFIVMEALTGHSMGEAFERTQSFSLDMLIHIMSEVLRGLSTVHDAGIVHRDLKPENIFLVHERGGKISPKLLDFGISRSLEPDTRRSAVTTTEGLILGTPQYMSPEQARGLGNIDKRTDIYSVGIIMFEALAGFVPFDSENMGDLLLKVIRGKPPPLHDVVPQIGSALCSVVDKALARSRELRYSDAGEMHDALVAAAARVPADCDRTALLFPPASSKERQLSRRSASEFPLSDATDSSGAPPAGEPAPERRTRKERRRSDENAVPTAVRPHTLEGNELTHELSSRRPRSAIAWAVGALAALSLAGAVVFALIPRGNGVIVVQAAPSEAPTPLSAGAPNAAGSAAPLAPALAAAPTRDEPELAAVKGVETRNRRPASGKPKPRAKPSTNSGSDALQQRAADVAAAFARQKESVIDCLDRHPEDMDGAPQLTVRLRLEPSGRVAEAALLPDSISAKSVGSCVARAVNAMTFATQPQVTTFRIPLLWRRR